MKGECQVMDLVQMETQSQNPSQKQTGHLDYVSEGKNILSCCYSYQSHFILVHISEEICFSVREEVLNTAKSKICVKKNPVAMPNAAISDILFRKVSDGLELVFVKLLFGSDELMALSRGK